MKIPKRRQKWLCDSIDAIMNSAYSDVMEASTYYSREEGVSEEHKCASMQSAMRTLYKIQLPLLVLWNVQKFETKDMAEWHLL